MLVSIDHEDQKTHTHTHTPKTKSKKKKRGLKYRALYGKILQQPFQDTNAYSRIIWQVPSAKPLFRTLVVIYGVRRRQNSSTYLHFRQARGVLDEELAKYIFGRLALHMTCSFGSIMILETEIVMLSCLIIGNQEQPPLGREALC